MVEAQLDPSMAYRFTHSNSRQPRNVRCMLTCHIYQSSLATFTEVRTQRGVLVVSHVALPTTHGQDRKETEESKDDDRPVPLAHYRPPPSLMNGSTSMACYWIDNEDALRCLIHEIDGIASDTPSFYIDVEGCKLGRFGTLDLLQIYVLPLRETFIVDVFTLKHAAFDTSFRGTSLRTLLESSSTKKVFFDVRNDSDAMFSLYNVLLGGVVDLR